MPKLSDSSAGDFKAVLYQYSIGYGFKIFYQKKTKANLLAQSYCYYGKKEDAVKAMHDRLNELIGISQDLFDFSKLNKK